MKNIFSTIMAVVVVGVSLGGAFLAGTYFGYEAKPAVEKIVGLQNKETLKDEEVDFGPFWEAWHLIDEKYVNGTSTTAEKNQERVWGAIAGMVRSLDDPYTVFFPPEEKKAFDESIAGNFSGVGMEVGVKDNLLTVIAPLPDSPAKKAGILAGDRILEVDGQATADLTIDEAVGLIRGDKGTTVAITIFRDGAEQAETIMVIRDTINIPTIDTEERGDVFIISLYNFNANAADLFKQALQKFVNSGRSKLILDLRGNPGGYLDASIDMASWFLPKDKVVVWEHKGAKTSDVAYRSRGYNVFADKENFKMVVLIDGGSASASEILAGALKEHGVATLVGQTTFGKGSVQELIPVSGGTSIKITIAKWLTPDGMSISDGGLEPDIEVEFTLEDFQAGLDPQMDKALELLK